ncbi:EGF domain-containing protein [Persicimonas caeni]|uniref:EGF domain-containing protein n=1 Tax=Persicimonas caeni TaxID=2292766 RepID=UPI001C9B97C6|nr:EGF domain-containing protein [Persicimonas caeni]
MADAALDVSEDTSSEDADIDAVDAPALSEIGEVCSTDDECESGRCETFGDTQICTTDCDETCEGEAVSCFEGTCVPTEYCEDPDGDGYGQGPGCEGTECDLCDTHASCSEDDQGQWFCACDEGYTGDGTTCTDVDECSDGTDDCADNATCTNTDGSFTCECDSGYTGDGTTCTDVDECANQIDNCDANATCTNEPGSFSCACDSGFTGDGTTCTDVDECATDTDNCDANATCTNEPGTFTCACDSGFTGDGVTCTDVDECATDTDNCDANATCTNTDGSFTCECPSTMIGDGITCRYPTSCMDALNNSINTGDGTYTIDADGTGANAPFDVYCDMTTDGGGWTLLGTQVNQDGQRNWDSQSVITDATTFGSIANRHSADFKSPAWTTVAGDDLMLNNAEYNLGYRGLLGNMTYDAHINANWPSTCNTTWMRSGADFGRNLTQTQLDTFGYTYRGHDSNADCFPNGNENTAISVLAADCCWVDGLSNTPSGQATWQTEDHSMVKLSNIVPQACTTGQWPCNDNGLSQTQSAQCYDASCKVVWVEVFVR